MLLFRVIISKLCENQSISVAFEGIIHALNCITDSVFSVKYKRENTVFPLDLLH